MTGKQAAAFGSLGILWGTEWIASGELGRHVPLLLGTAARFGLAAALLFPFMLVRWHAHRHPEKFIRGLRASLILSATLLALPVLLLSWAAGRVSTATTTVFFSATPLVVVLFSFIVREDRPSRTGWQALLLGWGGVALAIWNGSLPSFQGTAAVLLAVASSAASIVYAKRELAGISPVVSAGILLGGAAFLLQLASLVEERGQRPDWNLAAIVALLYLGVASAAGLVLYFWLLKELAGYQVATIMWIEPLLGMIQAAILFRQPLSLSMIAGLTIALGCLFAVMRLRANDDAVLTLAGTGSGN
ncbi:MAG TPA: DMT family transporter [Acidobacteriaceae bacterium]